MTIIDFFLLIVGISNLVLALFVGLNNKRDPVNFFFSLFAGSLFLWCTTLVIFRTIEDIRLAILFLKGSYLSVMLSASSFYVFIHYFPDRIPFDKFQKWFLGIITVVLAVFFLVPNILITEIYETPAVRVGIQEPLGFWLFSAYFLIYFLGALTILYRKRKDAIPADQIRLGYVLWSIVIAGGLGIFFNLVLPSPLFYNWKFTWLGPIFTAVIVLATSYAMARYNLFNIRIVATIVFVTALSLALLFNIFIPAPLPFQIVKVALFLAVLLVGYLLLRSILREITDKQRITALAADLASANQELKKLDQAKSEFVSIASHQLRAPLTVIKGYVSLALEGTLGQIGEQVRDSLLKVSISANQLVKLVSDLLNLSRIESGKIQYEFKPVDFPLLVEKVVREFKVNAEKKAIRLAFEKTADSLPSLNADPDKLREVVINLIDNAIKYSPQNGSVAISVGNSKTGNGILFSVKDSGIGIGGEDAARIFTKFTRTEEARKADPNGMGIGLYFVKRVVEDHKGRVWFESEGAGKGSTFFVELPLDK